MARRTPREFDRSEMAVEMFEAVFPKNQSHMPTNDEWKANRKLIGDLMNTKFQSEVAAPRTYQGIVQLVELWQTRSRLAEGRPFDVKDDVKWSGMDAALAVLFGNTPSMIQSSTHLLSTLGTIDLLQDKDLPTTFPESDLPAIYTYLDTVMSTVGLAHSSPAPRLLQRLALNFHPRYRRARLEKDCFIQDRLHESWLRLHRSPDREQPLDRAVDVIIQRELNMARKEGREPRYDSLAIQDEIFGLLFAGHDTTTASVLWGLKFLVANQNAQSKLRSSLRSAFKRAYEAGENPSMKEITSASIPYLDAFIEENGRLRNVGGALVRMAVVDTYLLGYRIPKGTDVFLVCPM